MEKTVYIKDFVTLPCSDAAPGIRKAIAYAAEQKASLILFEAGTYPLKSAVAFETDQTAHDAGAALLPTKDIHILLKNLKNITVSGAVHPNGDPATALVGFNFGALQTLLPSVLWMEQCENVTVKNFKFSRNPEFCSAGKVTAITGNTVYVEVFAGNPCHDNMGTHCINRFTPNGALNGESLSFGPGLPQKFRLVKDRLLSLTNEKIANAVAVDDILTFHQGALTDFQCFFGNSRNITLENLRTVNANGFAHLAFNIHNLTTKRVCFKPEGNQYFTAPRDAFKLHKCSGRIEMDEMYIEGVRMDGQNMHSNYLFPVETVDSRTLRVFTRYAYLDILEGSAIEFYKSNQQTDLICTKVVHEGGAEKDGHPGQLFTLTFAEDLPYPITEEVLCLASCWEPDAYICKNSVFKNIAGAGHLSRIDHMRIENCRYENTMNAGILLGTEFSNHVEGGHCTDIEIKNCTFNRCGNTARYGAKGCIGIKSEGLPGPNNRNIRILGCSFQNSAIGVDIHDAADVHIENCAFSQVAQTICVDSDTSEKIYVDLEPIL